MTLSNEELATDFLMPVQAHIDRLIAEVESLRRMLETGAQFAKIQFDEVERLREGLALAREWLKWDDIHEYAQQVTAGTKTVEARENFRAWDQKQKKGIGHDEKGH